MSQRKKVIRGVECLEVKKSKIRTNKRMHLSRLIDIRCIAVSLTRNSKKE
jgi:hypothetical protein